MNEIPDKPTLTDLQKYIKIFCEERGWVNNTYSELYLLFMEEVGELPNAMRNHAGLFSEEAKKNKKFDLEEEFADVLSYLMDLANLFNIDLEAAFRKKDALNRTRNWNN